MTYEEIVRKINAKKLRKFIDNIYVMKSLAEEIDNPHFLKSLEEMESLAKTVLESFD